MPKNFTYSNSGDSEITAYNYIEISLDPYLLNNFANEEGMAAFLESHECSEEFQKLRVKLMEEVMNIVENCLTEKQKEIIKMTYIQGLTQSEIASLTRRHQTSICKSLSGNLDYLNNRKRYGGSLKKLRKLCSNNKKIQKILKQMKNCSSGGGDK